MKEKELSEVIDRVREYAPEKSKFTPFQLTIHLQTPLALAHPWFHLDGILAHLLIRKLLDTKSYYLPSKSPLNFFSSLQLPLKTITISDKIIYCSSISFFNYSSLFATTIYKRFDDQHVFLLKRSPKKIQRNRGQYKDYAIKLPYIPATKIYFYGNGDIEEIDALLKMLPGLGKKVAIGYGFINSFVICKIKKDCSIINKNNIAMRPIPLEFAEDSESIEKVLLGYKFPYWGKQNICLCVPPGNTIKFRGDQK